MEGDAEDGRGGGRRGLKGSWEWGFKGIGFVKIGRK